MATLRLRAVMSLALTLLAACRPIEIGLELPAPPAASSSATPTAPPAASTAPAEPTRELTVATRPAEAFTPSAGWIRFVEPRYGLRLQYPSHWQMTADAPVSFSGTDGFFELYATNSQDNTLANACRDVQAGGGFGAAPAVELIFAGGQEACLVLPSADQDPAAQRRAALVVRFPQARATIVPGVAYTFLMLSADDQHVRTLAATLEFPPPAEPALEWRGAGPWGDGDAARCKALRAQADGLVTAGDCDELPAAVAGHLPPIIELAARLGSFQVETPAERLVVRGAGVLDGPAWQRAALNWARWTYAELASGRACAACRTALAWNLGAAEAGVCRQLTVLNYAFAYAETRPCAGGAALTHAEGWLTPEEWERLDEWLVTRTPVDDGGNYLAAEGGTPFSADELGMLVDFAQMVFSRMAAEN